MKISLDLDGTAFERPEFFSALMALFQSAGNEVGILTGHKSTAEDRDRRKLLQLGFPDPSFYFGRTEEYMPLNGAIFKSHIIDREGIDLHFDDCDYDHPDTIRLFTSLGTMGKIVRLKSKDDRFAGLRGDTLL